MADKNKNWAFKKGAEFANKRAKTKEEKEEYAKALTKWKLKNPGKDEQNFLEKAGSSLYKATHSDSVKKYKRKSKTGGI
jgi:hypothetical protein|tara:strand:+ start:225 stop:461 length:237 start_codon:yes stop_codon:yes gene_type:complete